MRAGICTIQQALTAEALSVVKQAVNHARRRGHAQVTPLHVASVMLATSGGHLRKACLQSHSHPLQCKALELCFNVALNRLPASTSSALLGAHSSFPSLSNALVAAFKRAQAHQRRGSVENQQQPILALKIEVEQLIISILDDPSVSRVMREAGFSSTQVKSRVEQSVSLETCSNNTPGISQSKEIVKKEIMIGTPTSQFSPFLQFGVTLGKILEPTRNEDVMCVLNTMVNKKRNTVIVGECVATSESVFRGVMDKIERGQTTEDLRSVKLLSVSLSSLRNLSKDEVEQKLMEVKCAVKTHLSRGVVLYLGDLTWVADFWSSYCEQKSHYYCSMEHIIMELQRIVRSTSDSRKVWLIGTSSLKAYMKCKVGHPSLETIWELFPIIIPAGSLCLSLNLNSNLSSTSESKNKSCWPLVECFGDNKASLKKNQTISSLPSWLQDHKEESISVSGEKECMKVRELCKKFHGQSHKPQYFQSKRIKFASSPSSPTSFSSHDEEDHGSISWPAIFQTSNFLKDEHCGPKPELLSNPNSGPNSTSSSEAIEDDRDDLGFFREPNTKNIVAFCKQLEEKVPWQKVIIPDIVSSILECRSGMQKDKTRQEKEGCWLFFLGGDVKGKEMVAKELGRMIFKSQSNFVSIRRRSNILESSIESKNFDYMEEFGQAVKENPHRVFFMEDLDQLSHSSIKSIKQVIERGKAALSCGKNVPLRDAIVILSCESFNMVSEEDDDQSLAETKPERLSLDLNIAIENDTTEDHGDLDGGLLEMVDKQFEFAVHAVGLP